VIREFLFAEFGDSQIAAITEHGSVAAIVAAGEQLRLTVDLTQAVASRPHLKRSAHPRPLVGIFHPFAGIARRAIALGAPLHPLRDVAGGRRAWRRETRHQVGAQATSDVNRHLVDLNASDRIEHRLIQNGEVLRHLLGRRYELNAVTAQVALVVRRVHFIAKQTMKRPNHYGVHRPRRASAGPGHLRECVTVIHIRGLARLIGEAINDDPPLRLDVSLQLAHLIRH